MPIANTLRCRLSRAAVAVLLLYRRVRYGYAFRRIRISSPKYTIVDPEDYEALACYEWLGYKSGQQFYAARQERVRVNGRRKVSIIPLHRQIMPVGKGLIVDHVNRDGLDNRKSNLRAGTQAQNICNSKRTARSSSMYKGVSWHKASKKWRALVAFGGKTKFLGYFADEVEAAKAYDAGARELHGEFAYLNFPERPAGASRR
ncbi:MAG: HNH endonuclease [Sedimentisphaerales bacterium]|nr:HNH endonuclease [Sedimentisphaerales bacterium]